MSLKDRLREASPSPAASFSCPHYEARPGSKRCRQYLEGGACARDDEFMCVEWLKANGHHVPPPAPSAPESASEPAPASRDLFGQPTAAPQPPAAPAPPPPDPAPPVEVPVVRNLTDEDIASFKALRAEVCMRSEDVGEIWLVPEYTGADRLEISVEHAATLTAICSAFPGAKVVSFEKRKPEEPDVPV